MLSGGMESGALYSIQDRIANLCIQDQKPVP